MRLNVPFLTVGVPLVLLLAAAGEPRVIGPFSAALNVPADIIGTPDTRPGTWGLAGAQTAAFVFREVPAGYRVRVLRLEGNYMAWARGVYGPGEHAGTSWGITTTVPGGSQRVSYAADDCFAYFEYGISNGEVNQAFSIDTRIGGLLEADNTFNFVSAVYLNDRPVSIHMETTLIMTYQFERVN